MASGGERRRARFYPSLYQLNTRAWLRQRGAALGRAATLDDIAEADLTRWAGLGMDYVWCLGVWRTGSVGREIARAIPELRQAYREALPDLAETDICGSCFSIAEYAVSAELGGLPALQRLRERMRAHGLRLILDFVPNHTARDHPWVNAHPEFYVQGIEADLAARPGRFCRIETSAGPRVFAHGRDPYFPPWTDTLQLNYGAPELQAAIRAELTRIADCCDGVRCDMAMLLLPEIFQRTWGIAMPPFWPTAIEAARATHPEFVFLAEVYWDLEWSLQQQGFDFTYDKRLYDRLRQHQAGPVRDHFRAALGFQQKLVRFLENHDEPRAAATYPPEVHKAAAVLAYAAPGLRFFHDGQLEGRRVRTPVQLCRAPVEPPDPSLQAFYQALLAALRRPALRTGEWWLLMCRPAQNGNASADNFIAFAWEGAGGERLLVAVNYADGQSQCYVPLPFDDLDDGTIRLTDLMSDARYDRGAYSLHSPGLYLDLPAWGHHVFELQRV